MKKRPENRDLNRHEHDEELPSQLLDRILYVAQLLIDVEPVEPAGANSPAVSELAKPNPGTGCARLPGV